jgi:hypothetical protein
MPALTADRNTPSRAGHLFGDPLAVGALIFAGAMYALDANGDAVTATAGGNKVRGVSHRYASQAAGDTMVDGRRGVYRFENDAGAITRADIGATAYVVDDNTVAKTGTAIAGTVLDVDDVGVWVEIGFSGAGDTNGGSGGA